MSVIAFDWATAQTTTDYVAKSVLVALGAVAGPDHKSRVSVNELSETISHPPRTVREVLAELEADELIAVERPVGSNGIGLVSLRLVKEAGSV